jgi:hypothetical protein
MKMMQHCYRRPSSSSSDENSINDPSHHAMNSNYGSSLHDNTSDSEEYEEEYRRNDTIPIIIPQNSFTNGRQNHTAESTDSSVLHPSKRANTASSATAHATKGGLNSLVNSMTAKM